MKKFYTLLLASVLSGVVIAQEVEPSDSSWSYNAVGTLNFTQLGLSNWAAGGENSLSLVGFIRANANYKKNDNVWENSLELGYGMLKQGSRDFVKSDDRIKLNSIYKNKAKGNWSYATALGFETTFDLGFNDPFERDSVVSQFMAPGIINLSVGMDYKPNDKLSVYMSPIALKAIYVLAEQVDETQYGLKAGDKARYELGASLIMNYKTTLMENVTYQTRLELYSNYIDSPQNIDVKWFNTIVMQVNKYISMNLQTEMLYDDNTVFLRDNGTTGKAVQFKEVLGLGLTYKLL